MLSCASQRLGGEKKVGVALPPKLRVHARSNCPPPPRARLRRDWGRATGIDRSRTLPRRMHGSESLLSCPSSSWNDSPRYSKRLEDRALVVRELACDDPGNVLDGQPGFPRLIYLSVELWFVLRGTIFSSCRCNCRGDHAARPGTVLIRAQSLDGCCP